MDDRVEQYLARSGYAVFRALHDEAVAVPPGSSVRAAFGQYHAALAEAVRAWEGVEAGAERVAALEALVGAAAVWDLCALAFLEGVEDRRYAASVPLDLQVAELLVPLTATMEADVGAEAAASTETASGGRALLQRVARWCALGRRADACQCVRWHEHGQGSGSRVGDDASADVSTEPLSLLAVALQEAPPTHADARWTAWQEDCVAVARELECGSDACDGNADREDAETTLALPSAVGQLLQALGGMAAFPAPATRCWSEEFVATLTYRTRGDGAILSCLQTAAETAERRFPTTPPGASGVAECGAPTVTTAAMVQWALRAAAYGNADECVVVLSRLRYGRWSAAHLADLLQCTLRGSRAVRDRLVSEYAEHLSRQLPPSAWRIGLRYAGTITSPARMADIRAAAVSSSATAALEEVAMTAELPDEHLGTASSAVVQCSRQRAERAERAGRDSVAFYEWSRAGEAERAKRAVHRVLAKVQRAWADRSSGDRTAALALLENLDIAASALPPEPHRAYITYLSEFLADIAALAADDSATSASAAALRRDAYARAVSLLGGSGLPERYRTRVLSLLAQYVSGEDTAETSIPWSADRDGIYALLEAWHTTVVSAGDDDEEEEEGGIVGPSHSDSVPLAPMEEMLRGLLASRCLLEPDAA
ncbi:hypothetical protein CDCA_CDCA15G4040 [Cyanidium caldarium]|uniref:Nuclear pore complex protein Nup85 n=1 Tax=Cyanidium caldarium TaxID=2771 RepID=A0AAV9J103_CYACA|nr:hypothetical protein CDCA_CDCA15G4040 [Cyanidium caldarium]